MKSWKKLDRAVEAFLAMKPLESGRSLGFGVRLNGGAAILTWRGKIDGRRVRLMRLAEWSENRLMIPGPPKGSMAQKDLWCWLVRHAIWGDDKCDFPNIIAYLMERAMIKARGKVRGEREWLRVKDAVPYPYDGRILKWRFTNSGGRPVVVPFSYPFECSFNASDGRLPEIISPSPDKIRDILLEHLNVSRTADFLIRLQHAYPGITISRKEKKALIKKSLEDRLDVACPDRGRH